MTGMTALQVAPVERLDPGEAGNVFGMSGIGVTVDGDEYLLSITDPNGLSLTARLDEAKLDSFAHRLAFAIEEKNAAARGPLPRLGEPGERLVRRIILSVAFATGTGTGDIEGYSREKHIVLARQAAIWAARVCSTCSYPELARIFGGRDHTTIIDQFRAAGKRRGADGAFRTFTDALRTATLGDNG